MSVARHGSFYTVEASGGGILAYMIMSIVVWAFNLTLGLAFLVIRLVFLLIVAIFKGSAHLISRSRE